MTWDVGKIAVDRDGRTHSGPSREEQQGRPGDRNAQGVTRERGALGLGWAGAQSRCKKGRGRR